MGVVPGVRPPEPHPAIAAARELNDRDLYPRKGPQKVPTGIFEAQEAPPGMGVAVENRWVDLVDGRYVAAFAGWVLDRPNQGIILLKVTTLDLYDVDFFFYPTPEKVGPVRIDEVTQGLRLKLSAEDGTRFVFDVRSRSYV